MNQSQKIMNELGDRGLELKLWDPQRKLTTVAVDSITHANDYLNKYHDIIGDDQYKDHYIELVDPADTSTSWLGRKMASKEAGKEYDPHGLLLH